MTINGRHVLITEDGGSGSGGGAANTPSEQGAAVSRLQATLTANPERALRMLDRAEMEWGSRSQAEQDVLVSALARLSAARLQRVQQRAEEEWASYLRLHGRDPSLRPEDLSSDHPGAPYADYIQSKIDLAGRALEQQHAQHAETSFAGGGGEHWVTINGRHVLIDEPALTDAARSLRSAHPFPEQTLQMPNGGARPDLVAQDPELRAAVEAYLANVSAYHRAYIASLADRLLHSPDIQLVAAPPEGASQRQQVSTARRAVRQAREEHEDVLALTRFGQHSAAVAASHPEGQRVIDAALRIALARHQAALDNARSQVSRLPAEVQANAQRVLATAMHEDFSLDVDLY